MRGKIILFMHLNNIHNYNNSISIRKVDGGQPAFVAALGYNKY